MLFVFFYMIFLFLQNDIFLKKSKKIRDNPLLDFAAVKAVIVLMIGNPHKFSELADSTTFCCEIQFA